MPGVGVARGDTLVPAHEELQGQIDDLDSRIAALEAAFFADPNVVKAYSTQFDPFPFNEARIQAAIDYAETLPGKSVVLLGSYTYTVNPTIRVELKTGISVFGNGPSTMIVRDGIYDKTQFNQRYFWTQSKVQDVWVKDIFFDGRLRDIPYGKTQTAGGAQNIGGVTILTGTQDLSAATLNVRSTVNIPASGTVRINDNTGVMRYIAYTGVTVSTLTGCSGGTGTASDRARVYRCYNVNVASTMGPPEFPTSANILVDASDGETYSLPYQSKTAGAFLNVSGGPGVQVAVADATSVYEVSGDAFVVAVALNPLSGSNKHTHVVLENLTIYDHPGAAIFFNDTKDSMIINNTLDHIDRGGIIGSRGNEYLTIQGNDVFSHDDCIAIGSGDAAFDPIQSHHISILGNITRSNLIAGERASNNGIKFGGVRDSIMQGNFSEEPGGGIATNKSCYNIGNSPGYPCKRIQILGNIAKSSFSYGVTLTTGEGAALVNGLQDLSAAEPFTFTIKPPATDPDNPEPTRQFEAAGKFLVGGYVITYTGKTDTTFTGCRGGAGTVADGLQVSMPYENVMVANNTVDSPGDMGIRLSGSGINTEIRNNHITNAVNNPIFIGIGTDSQENLTVRGNVIKDCGKAGILFGNNMYLSNLTLKDNKLRTINTSNAANTDGIQLRGAAIRGFTINGNEISQDTELTTALMRYGISVVPTGTGADGVFKDNKVEKSHTSNMPFFIDPTLVTNTFRTLYLSSMPQAQGGGTDGTNSAMVAHQIYITHYPIYETVKMSGLWVMVGATVTSGGMFIWLYNSKGQVMASRAASQNVAGFTVNTWNQVAFSTARTLQAGDYYVGVQVNSAVPTYRSIPAIAGARPTASIAGGGAGLSPDPIAVPTGFTADQGPIVLPYS